MPDPIVESAAPPEVQAKAEKLGWIPPSRFKGDPERFIDAADYIERGETVLPIVRAQNGRLQAEIENLRGENQRTLQALKAATDAINNIEERHSVETQKAVERARADVKAQLAAASAAGDHDGVAELTDQLTKLNQADQTASTKPIVTEPPSAAYVPPADLKAWNDENPWFGTDKRKTALALGIAQELREAGDTSQGRVFFDKVTEELNNTLGVSQAPAVSKVEGGRGSSDGGSATASGKKGYAALPADAKAACDADSRRFVGAGKKYKTADEWRARYAEMYFGS